MKSQFTNNERTILIGLLAVARRQLSAILQTENAVRELIGEPEPTGGRASDAVFGASDDPIADADLLINLCRGDAETEARLKNQE